MNAKHYSKRPRATAQDVILALTSARAAAVTPRRALQTPATSSMRRTLQSQGLSPVEDPGAGLPPAQASMARAVARMGR